MTCYLTSNDIINKPVSEGDLIMYIEFKFKRTDKHKIRFGIVTERISPTMVMVDKTVVFEDEISFVLSSDGYSKLQNLLSV